MVEFQMWKESQTASKAEFPDLKYIMTKLSQYSDLYSRKT